MSKSGDFTHWRNTAHAGARVTEQAFNCKHLTLHLVPLRETHSSITRCFAQTPYLYDLCKKWNLT